jgi:hypothetical protein
MAESRTEHANYLFRVKVNGDGTPWIYSEARHKDISVLEHGILAFSLPEGTTLKPG